MILFILTFFAMYGGVHAYAFLRVRSALGFGTGTGAALAVFMLVMTFAPYMIRAAELRGYELAARVLSYVAYLWMAVLFLFFCGSLVFDFLNIVTRAADWITRSDLSSFLIASKTSFLISLGLALAISFYGYFDALDIRTEHLRIETTKLPAGVERITIAQISDVHLGLIIRSDRLRTMLQVVKDAKPDIFVSTGDLVDAQINHLTGLAVLFREIPAQYGKFAIMGNHEYFAGPEKALAFIKEAGFTPLRNESVEAGPITIAGIDDRTGERLKLRKPFDEQDVLAKLPRDKFILLLKHQPLIDPASLGHYDLQLSGHTHKGQIFPFTLLTRLSYPLNAGRYDLGSGSILYVSRGTGTWGPPIRFLSPPEVTIIELVRKASQLT